MKAYFRRRLPMAAVRARFFDTNILVYAFAAADLRSASAQTLTADGRLIGIQCSTNLQV